MAALSARAPAASGGAALRVPLLLGVLLLVLAAPQAATGRALSQTERYPNGGFPPSVRFNKYLWRVSLGEVSPDCYLRDALLVNGQLAPTFEVEQGEAVEFTLCNDIPPNWPNVQKGISVHWHGWKQNGTQWYDGVGYVTQCPVLSGTCFTSRFIVNEMPGSYLWHGHVGNDRSEGFQGPLIVRPRRGVPQPVPTRHTGEHIAFLDDWWHTVGGALSMPLNRPFDAARQTADSGGWAWVNNPQALLINGRGNWMDCKINAAGQTTPPVVCPVTDYTVPPGASAAMPWASAANPGCTHTNFTVRAGQTYLFRVMNAANLAYQTLCFEAHDVTIVALDAVPIEPVRASAINPARPGCIDINAGQRVDVLLTANRPVANYWVSSQVQFRNGSPSGYAVLRYVGAPNALPATPPPQPQSVEPWTPAEQDSKFVMASRLLAAGAAGRRYPGYEEAMKRVPAASVRLQLNITQPLMSQTGQLRWALNNVVSLKAPPCEPLLDLLKRDPKWIQRNLVPATTYNAPGFQSSGLGKQEGGSGKVQVFVTSATSKAPPPIYPVAGTHVLPLKRGAVVDLILQNLPANSNNGDYRVPAGANRTAQEQHPFHLHGQHFWVLGSGQGTYDHATNARALNTVNPPRRDTATLPKEGWVVVRFEATNPGVWLLHCHLLWHELMGQAAVFVVEPSAVPPRPWGMPACSRTCTYNAAPWSVSTVNKQFGGSGFELPRAG